MEARLAWVASTFIRHRWYGLVAHLRNILINFIRGMYSGGAQAVRREKTYKV